eukprot:NODE_117_length_18986_cov_0.639540.p10 type:complete len:169 gc:universal NODE_117_length_18986_cov_0.639540:4545-4039(-)
MMTWWVVPFTLVLAVYSLIMVLSMHLAPLYAIYMATYVIDFVCQVVNAFYKVQYQKWILLANAILFLLSIGIIIYTVSTFKYLKLVMGIFHLFVMFYFYSTVLLFACSSKKTLNSSDNLDDSESMRNHRSRTLKKYVNREDSQSHLDYYFMEPINKKDSFWLIANDNQ